MGKTKTRTANTRAAKRIDNRTADRASESAEEHRAALGAQARMLWRMLAVYVLAALILIWAAGVGWTVGHQVFTHVPFPAGAPVLTASATIAIGLHVAVYNLSHEKEAESLTPHILSRLDLFATAGVATAVIAAIAGLLMVYPEDWSDLTAPDGLSFVGLLLSSLVVFVSCLAGHITPAGAIAYVDEARRREQEAWIDRAIEHWDGRPLGWTQHSIFVASVMFPLTAWCAAVVAVGRSESSWTAATGAVIALAALSCLPTLMLLATCVLIVLRLYALMVLAVGGVAGALLVAHIVWAPYVDDWHWLAAGVACVWPATLAAISAQRTPRPWVGALVPGTTRSVVLAALRSRRAHLVRSPSRGRWSARLRRARNWLRSATGRELLESPK